MDYNTRRAPLRLKAYGREIQQMVDRVSALPNREARQRGARLIVDAMKRVVDSPLSHREREPMLWYHLALLSDFKLDIDYPYEFPKEDKLSTPPHPVRYGRQGTIATRHYGRLLGETFAQLRDMPDNLARRRLARETAAQMYRCLAQWGMGAVSKDRVAADINRLTGGTISFTAKDFYVDKLVPVNAAPMPADDTAKKKKKKKKKKKQYQW